MKIKQGPKKFFKRKSRHYYVISLNLVFTENVSYYNYILIYIRIQDMFENIRK